MGGHAVGLPSLEEPKPLLVSVDYLKGVAGLGDPEAEISNVSGKLVPVEGDESRQLIGHNLRHVFGERHGTPSSAAAWNKGNRPRQRPD